MPDFSVASVLQPAKLMTWLGASAGGLGILLVFIDLLARGAHDKMLGLPWKLQPQLEYCIDGALFVARTVLFISASLLVSSRTWVIAGLFTIALVTLRVSWENTLAQRGLIQVLILSLFAAEAYCLWRLSLPLRLTNMLTDQTVLDQGTDEIFMALMSNNGKWLGLEYGCLAFMVCCVTVMVQRLDSRLSAALEARTGGGLWRTVRPVAYGLVILNVCLTPGAYGVLTLPNRYPEVEVTMAATATVHFDKGTALVLLEENEASLLLYDTSARVFITLARTAVEEMRRSGAEPIFRTWEALT